MKNLFLCAFLFLGFISCKDENVTVQPIGEVEPEAALVMENGLYEVDFQDNEIIYIKMNDGIAKQIIYNYEHQLAAALSYKVLKNSDGKLKLEAIIPEDCSEELSADYSESSELNFDKIASTSSYVFFSELNEEFKSEDGLFTKFFSGSLDRTERNLSIEEIVQANAPEGRVISFCDYKAEIEKKQLPTDGTFRFETEDTTVFFNVKGSEYEMMYIESSLNEEIENTWDRSYMRQVYNLVQDEETHELSLVAVANQEIIDGNCLEKFVEQRSVQLDSITLLPDGGFVFNTPGSESIIGGGSTFMDSIALNVVDQNLDFDELATGDLVDAEQSVQTCEMLTE